MDLVSQLVTCLIRSIKCISNGSPVMAMLVRMYIHLFEPYSFNKNNLRQNSVEQTLQVSNSPGVEPAPARPLPDPECHSISPNCRFHRESKCRCQTTTRTMEGNGRRVHR